jgi:hypothetical protein
VDIPVEVVAIRSPEVILELSDGAELVIAVIPMAVVRKAEKGPNGELVYNVSWQGIVRCRKVPPEFEPAAQH